MWNVKTAEVNNYENSNNLKKDTAKYISLFDSKLRLNKACIIIIKVFYQ